MNKGTIAALTSLAILAACGGGGSSSSPGSTVIPPQASNKGPGGVQLKFKIPNQSTMARVRRPYYSSQATQGVGIDWVSTDPTHPDYAAAVGATCPATAPAGVASCTVSSTGTVYTFQLPIPAGSYPNFTVSAFDAPPATGTPTAPTPPTFLTPDHMLAQGQINGGITVTAGTNNTIALTFYGIPASVGFGPAASQSHVVAETGGGYGIIGNAPQTFVAQAVDADGFAISSNDSGAPVLSIAEASGDAPQEFLTAKAAANNYSFSVQTKAASPTAGTAGQIVVTAAPQPASVGLSTLTSTVNVTAIPELWFTYAPFGGTSGYIYGYALSGANYGAASNPIDVITTSYLPGPMAVDTFGNLWVAAGTNTSPIQEYNAESNSNPPSAGSTITPVALCGGGFGAPTVMGLVIDTFKHLWIADSTPNYGEIASYDVSTPSSPGTAPLSSLNTGCGGSPTPATLSSPIALALGPSSGLPAGLQNTLWVYSSGVNGTAALDVLSTTSGGVASDTFDNVTLPVPVGVASPAPTSVIGAIAVSSNTSVWYYDSASGTLQEVTSALSGPTTITLTARNGTAVSSPIASQLPLDPTEAAGWIGSYKMTGYNSSLASFSTALPNGTDNQAFGMFIAP